MNYKNGREVKVGDKFVGRDFDGSIMAGTVVDLIPGDLACNIKYAPSGVALERVTASYCLHLDDAVPLGKKD